MPGVGSFLKESRAKFDEASAKGRSKINRDGGKFGPHPGTTEKERADVVARPLTALKDPSSFPPPPIHRTAHGQTPVASPAPTGGVVPTAQPAQPVYGQPVQPAYGQPAQPAYGQPAQPAYGQPAYGQPAQPAQQAYVQPTGQPTHFGYESQTAQYQQPSSFVPPAYTLSETDSTQQHQPLSPPAPNGQAQAYPGQNEVSSVYQQPTTPLAGTPQATTVSAYQNPVAAQQYEPPQPPSSAQQYQSPQPPSSAQQYQPSQPPSSAQQYQPSQPPTSAQQYQPPQPPTPVQQYQPPQPPSSAQQYQPPQPPQPPSSAQQYQPPQPPQPPSSAQQYQPPQPPQPPTSAQQYQPPQPAIPQREFLPPQVGVYRPPAPPGQPDTPSYRDAQVNIPQEQVYQPPLPPSVPSTSTIEPEEPVKVKVPLPDPASFPPPPVFGGAAVPPPIAPRKNGSDSGRLTNHSTGAESQTSPRPPPAKLPDPHSFAPPPQYGGHHIASQTAVKPTISSRTSSNLGTEASAVSSRLAEPEEPAMPNRPVEPPMPARPSELPMPAMPSEPPMPARPSEPPMPARPTEPLMPARPTELPVPLRVAEPSKPIRPSDAAIHTKSEEPVRPARPAPLKSFRSSESASSVIPPRPNLVEQQSLPEDDGEEAAPTTLAQRMSRLNLGGGVPNFAAQIAERKSKNTASSQPAFSSANVLPTESLATPSSGQPQSFAAALAHKKKPPPKPPKKPSLKRNVTGGSVVSTHSASSERISPPPPPPPASRGSLSPSAHTSSASSHGPPLSSPSISRTSSYAPPPPASRSSPSPIKPAASFANTPPPVPHHTRPVNAPRASFSKEPTELFDLELGTGWFAKQPPQLPKSLAGSAHTYSSTWAGNRKQLKVASRQSKDWSVIRVTLSWLQNDPIGTVTVERHDTPAPKDLTASQIKAYNEHFGDRVAGWAESKMGSQVGNGECWTLAQQAVAHGCNGQALEPAGTNFGFLIASFNSSSHGHPTVYKDQVRRGDVIQFYAVETQSQDGLQRASYGAPDHTAIVTRSTPNSWKFELVHQNIGGVKRVQTGVFDASEIVKGQVNIYRVVGKEWAGEL